MARLVYRETLLGLARSFGSPSFPRARFQVYIRRSPPHFSLCNGLEFFVATVRSHQPSSYQHLFAAFDIEVSIVSGNAMYDYVIESREDLLHDERKGVS